MHVFVAQKLNKGIDGTSKRLPKCGSMHKGDGATSANGGPQLRQGVKLRRVQVIAKTGNAPPSQECHGKLVRGSVMKVAKEGNATATTAA